MKPFIYKTKITDIDNGKNTGFFMVRGREDGSWSVHLHHWEKASSGCDTPEACYPAAMDTLDNWMAETVKRHKEGLAIILSWPESRPGYRQGWKSKELRKAGTHMARTIKAVEVVRRQVRDLMAQAEWP